MKINRLLYGNKMYPFLTGFITFGLVYIINNNYSLINIFIAISILIVILITDSVYDKKLYEILEKENG